MKRATLQPVGAATTSFPSNFLVPKPEPEEEEEEEKVKKILLTNVAVGLHISIQLSADHLQYYFKILFRVNTSSLTRQNLFFIKFTLG